MGEQPSRPAALAPITQNLSDDQHRDDRELDNIRESVAPSRARIHDGVLLRECTTTLDRCRGDFTTSGPLHGAHQWHQGITSNQVGVGSGAALRRGLLVFVVEVLAAFRQPSPRDRGIGFACEQLTTSLLQVVGSTGRVIARNRHHSQRND
jgi:hypothetical protein